MDLPAIVEQFSSRFDELSEAVAGLPAVRVFIGTSVLVSAYVVHRVKLSDGAVELVGVEFDL